MKTEAFITGVLFITCAGASICNFQKSEIGRGQIIGSGSQYSSSDGCECAVSFTEEGINDNYAKVELSVAFVIEDEEIGECPPFMFVEAPNNNYYMCPKSSKPKSNTHHQGLYSSSQMYLYLHNPNNRRFIAQLNVTGTKYSSNASLSVSCASSSHADREFIGSCPCTDPASPYQQQTGKKNGDDFSTSKRLGIGFGAAFAIMVVMAVIYVAYILYKRRELREEKTKAADQGHPHGGAANPGYTGSASGIYSEISPQGTPVKLTQDPDLNLNMAKSPGDFVPYRGSTDSGLYSSASVERPAGISRVPDPGYATVDLQAPGHGSTPGMGSRASSQPTLAGFGAVPGSSPPQMSAEEVEAMYAKPMRRGRKGSGSRTPSRHASRDSLNRPPSRHPSRDALDKPPSRYGSRDALDKPPSRHGSRDGLDVRPVSRHGSRDGLDVKPVSRYGSRELLGPRADSRDMMNKSAAGVSEITVGFSYNPDPSADEGQRSHNITNNSIETEI